MVNFPANMFDSTGTFVWYAFQYAWRNCALSAQSIENILVSLDTNGQSDITLHVDDGTNANASTWSIAATNAFNNLITKGWTIGKEGTISNLIYNISSSGGVFNLRSSGSVNFTVDWGDGSAIRDFAYSEDVADGIILTMIKGTGNFDFLNLGSGKGYKIKELVETMASFIDFKYEFVG